MSKLKLKKGETVRVIAGDAKGQEGKILSVDLNKNRAIIEGVNMLSKHAKPSAKNPNGGIVKQEGSIHVSNLMLVVGGKTTRVGRQVNEKTGKIERIAKKTKEVIN